MRLLLDTQALIWFAAGDPRLGRVARKAIEQSECTVSAIAVWEIVIKQTVGRVPIPPPKVVELVEFGFAPLPVTVEHAIEVAELPRHHADPFDRMMIAQARLDGLTLLTADAAIHAYDVPILEAAA